MHPLDQIKNLPNNPGIYQMFNAKGHILYVGKSRDLKKRVSSYFHRQLDTKTQAMIAQVADIQITITANENDALLLEANLIKEHKPPYNVLLRDDKSYPYLFFSVQDAFPRLDFYRGIKQKKGRYFGPYPNAGSVRENLSLIQKLFKIRQCRDTFFKNRTRPCLQYQIKRCTAPCVGYVNQTAYAEQVAVALLFLEGKNTTIIDDFIQKMNVSSAKQQYEEAAFYRDQIKQLRKLQQQQTMIGDDGNIDVMGAYVTHGQAAVSVLYIRAGRLIGHKNFFPRTPAEIDSASVLSAFIPQYYLSPIHQENVPQRLVLNEKLIDKNWIQSALKKILNISFHITDQPYKSYRHWQNMASLNARQALTQHLSEKQKILDQLQDLQKKLNLPQPIQRIECFDVSHSVGEATYASCVVFNESGLYKKEYRLFKINNIKPGDDYAALRQALTRRYTRFKLGEGILPDLLMIDGGKGQLTQAAQMLEELQISGLPVIAIAKGPLRKPGLEQIFLLGKETPVPFSSENKALHLLQQIRDEAHRFAITAHRRKITKRSYQSPLVEIEGIGPKRRQQLLNHFGGLQELKKASIAEITQVPGISERIAQNVYDALHK